MARHFVRFLMISFMMMSLTTPHAQESKPAAQAEGKALPLTSKLPDDYPVITIPGLCPAASAKNTSTARHNCKTVITRAAFEKMVNAIDPAMPKYERHELARNYGRNIILAQRAREIGLDKEPQIRELLRYSEIRILSTELQQKMFKDYSHFSPADVAKFYDENQKAFEQFTLARIVIPLEKQGETGDNPAPSTAAAMKALAQNIHTRAVVGEDFDKLQQEVFEASGIQGKANTKMTDVNREMLPEAHRPALDATPGTVAPLLSDPGGHYVYKVVAVQVPPLDSVKQQVELRLQRKKAFEALERVQNSGKPEVNDTYFDKYDAPTPKDADEVEND